LGSIGMFLAELFFMGTIFAGVILLLRYIVGQTMDTNANKGGARGHSEFFPLLGKHQD
jgi:hypothetical protein